MTEHGPNHPDFGELEAYRSGEAEATVTEHVAACSDCRLIVEEIAELAELVRREAMPVPEIPPLIDQRIRRAGREAAERGQRRQMRLRLQRWALAGGVVLGLGGLLVARRAHRSPASLDAVDALLLARQIAAAPAVDRRFDFNQDGKVDARDVDVALRRVVSVLVAPAMAQQPVAGEVRFTRIAVYVDAGGDGLAAYQVEITTTGDAKIVGIASGDSPAFAEPAYYDPVALHRGGLIILAAISTAADLPHGRTRVAELQMAETGDVAYKIRLMAAARADGSRFEPAVSVGAP